MREPPPEGFTGGFFPTAAGFFGTAAGTAFLGVSFLEAGLFAVTFAAFAGATFFTTDFDDGLLFDIFMQVNLGRKF